VYRLLATVWSPRESPGFRVVSRRRLDEQDVAFVILASLAHQFDVAIASKADPRRQASG
jgi:hypothetical protein